MAANVAEQLDLVGSKQRREAAGCVCRVADREYVRLAGHAPILPPRACLDRP
jgi:hypothetical protein